MANGKWLINSSKEFEERITAISDATGSKYPFVCLEYSEVPVITLPKSLFANEKMVFGQCPTYIRLLASSLSSLRSPFTRLTWANRFWSRMRSII